MNKITKYSMRDSHGPCYDKNMRSRVLSSYCANETERRRTGMNRAPEVCCQVGVEQTH